MSDMEYHWSNLPGVAKSRMQRWLASPGLREYLEKAVDTGRKPKKTRPYISISRQEGTGGSQIARLVAQRMGWDMLDKELLDFMAERYDMPRGMLEFVDETRANWLRDVLSSWFDSRVVSHEKFVTYLQRLIYLAAIHGNVVFVGRGAQVILPRCSGLAVRLVAPMDFRVNRRMQRREVDRPEAKRQISEADVSQSGFYRQFFHQDCCNPELYDFTINVSRFSQETVCEAIVDMFARAEYDLMVDESAYPT